MKLLTTSELSADPEAYIDLAAKEKVFVAQNGKISAQLVAVVDGIEIYPEE